MRGGFTTSTFSKYRLPTSIVTALVSASNNSLALNTWATYKTAENHLKRCEADTGVQMRFPMDDRMVLAFVGWLITVRGVGASTIKQYLSGLRTVHLKRGFFPGNLRPDIIKSIIKGREQQELKTKIPRLAMTLPILKLLKALLKKSNMSLERKRLAWVICCMAFHGSFRIHELLSKKQNTYDPNSTLLGVDVRLVKLKIDGADEEMLVVHLKSPKEQVLSTGVKVELFATNTFSCPVSAWKKWRKVDRFGLSPTKPVFRTQDGMCFTGAQFNRDLKQLLGEYINYDKNKFLSHSFRAGMASMMALAGYRDEEIMRQGRWNSCAFKLYCKTGRATRLREQRDLARNLINV